MLAVFEDNAEKLWQSDGIKLKNIYNEKETFILETIGSDEMPADLIMNKYGYNVIELNSLLTIMEMKGLIENVGGRYRKKI